MLIGTDLEVQSCDLACAIRPRRIQGPAAGASHVLFAVALSPHPISCPRTG